MEYLHYSDTPIITFIDGVKQENLMKPTGLWLSEGSQWQDWCDSEGFATCNMNNCYIYSASINKDRLFVISSLDVLNTLHEKYEKKNKFFANGYIDWKEVANDYDGICFENYYEVKKDYFTNSSDFGKTWFLAVDVSGACIWNPSSVVSEWKMTREGVHREVRAPKFNPIFNKDFIEMTTEVA